MNHVKKVYYAHPVALHCTMRERAELELISAAFPGAEIINPAELVGVASHVDMSEYHELVASCDVLVFSDIAGFTTAGVAEEVEKALENDIPVFRLDWRTGKLVKVHKVNNKLSVEDTRKLFSSWNATI